VEAFRQSLGNLRSEYARASVEIGASRIEGQDAQVDITILRASSDLFSDPYRDQQSAQLIQEGGQWRIVQMPYPYWSYEWTPSLIKAEPVGR
jgi:hypothetical protein